MDKQAQAIEIMADSARGVYIPQHFAESCADGWEDIAESDRATLLRGPDNNDWYWDSWDATLSHARYVADNGDVYTLHHDGDLFAVCHNKLTDEERENMGLNF